MMRGNDGCAKPCSCCYRATIDHISNIMWYPQQQIEQNASPRMITISMITIKLPREFKYEISSSKNDIWKNILLMVFVLLDSEWSDNDKCIHFTMMCLFYLCLSSQLIQ